MKSARDLQLSKSKSIKLSIRYTHINLYLSSNLSKLWYLILSWTELRSKRCWILLSRGSKPSTITIRSNSSNAIKGLHRSTKKKNIECWNCKGPHHERVCKSPCSECGPLTHTHNSSVRCKKRRKEPGSNFQRDKITCSYSGQEEAWGACKSPNWISTS